MTKYKKDITAEYAALENIPFTEAEKRVDTVLELIAGHLVAGEAVKLVNFYNFFPKDLGAKPALHPQTGEPMTIEATRTCVARMSKPFKQRIQGKR